MTPTDKTAPSQTEALSFEFDLKHPPQKVSGFKPHQKQNFGGARYGWNMMGGRLIELLARTP